METSKTTNTIMPLLFEVQTEMEAVIKGSENPYFHSNYADLNSVMDACKTILNNRSLFVMQPVGHDEYGDYVETIIMHTSGEFVSSKMKLVPTTDAQKQGSAITYARRYSLQSLLFMQAVDDDGNTASQPVKTNTQAYTGNKTEVTQAMLEEDLNKLGNCPKCNAPMAISTKGNAYCTAKCWLKQYET